MTTDQMKTMVLHAADRRLKRQDGRANHADLEGASLRKAIVMTKEAESMLQLAFDSLGISLRAHDRILKLARTIADLDGHERVDSPHIAEAIGYRSLDRKLQAL
ncbi:hypothetical protein GXP70_12245 [Paenibacillus lycopersici]|uniref:Mg chelatase-related protein C-terminal domain-containing protein n=2 Tax=Paenibacillus lycopersici TaxID=2704462 RepID=A0A6C0G5X8_9BACL|nr:hypothetical protein [Paenibacillus lycopersici]QHT60635.1 hypothetical protein GXP70_12245 [Paenibacillus lycopersici]